jgi:sulfatase modifying factor 1
VTRGGALLAFGGSALLAACSGEGFALSDGAAAASQGGSAFPPLGTTDNQNGPDAGGGTGGAAPEPTVSPCGELRPGASSDDAEICIEAGTFTMGNTEARVPDNYTVHGPAHEVTLSAFVLDAKEVTVGRYRACVSAGTCTAPLTSVQQGCSYTASSGTQDRLPVTCVSWNDASIFCEWDGGRRLPSEAEWERAARGATGTTYAWGDDVSCLNAVFGGAVQCPEHGGLLPKEVGSTPRGASPEGALDLTGNAWEWVGDWFGPYASTPATDPVGPNNGASRILRGGNWQTPPTQAAAFMRRAEAPAAIGPSSFRCARSMM